MSQVMRSHVEKAEEIVTWLEDMWARQHVGMILHGRQVGPMYRRVSTKIHQAYASAKPRGHILAGFVGLRK
ncbi:hypothetical protein VNO78_08124 [Psophocarpus tetragonolobus]|uniref:Uncharacterized protein n=1 Tax=Psophocarpus tetragonolobus TaxID=3891 RepID=A0AAN9T4I8_PSOTE